jgi:hypothetical protein
MPRRDSAERLGAGKAPGSATTPARGVLTRIVARHPMGRIDELLPFAYVSAADKAAA